MGKAPLVVLWISLILFSVACASENTGSQETALPTATPVIRPTAISFIPPPEITPSPQSSLSGSESPAWSELGLTGRLATMMYSPEGHIELVALDLPTGVQTTLFRPSQRGSLAGFRIAPDGRQIALAYAAPLAEGITQVGNLSLYLVPADGSEPPRRVIEHDNSREALTTPAWSPDGRWLYFTHYTRLEDGSGPGGLPFQYTVDRVRPEGGPAEVVVENAIWPNLSPDGSQLAYLAFDAATLSHDLYVANSDGTNGRPVIPPDTFIAVDAHFFSPDGQWLYFSAVSDLPQNGGWSWLDRVLGVRPALAHNVPSDWWRVPVAGGAAERITDLLDTGLYGDFSPDGRTIAFLGASGLYVMEPDGRNLTRLAGVVAFGALQWLQ